MFSSPKHIAVGARASPLSHAQVDEVQHELVLVHPHVILKAFFVETTGDLDQKTSLRTLGRTDFFTKEVDALVLSGQCRIAIHSAKDLPEPLTRGLTLICLTRGQDPADCLVLRDGETLESLPSGAAIATSSERREAAVLKLRDDLAFCDVRGTISQRLSLLEEGLADGVVVAEAALIRLGLTHLNRIRLPGATTPLQGQLAIVGREKDFEVQELFSCLDTRPALV